MAARRLVVVMVVLLGISTAAAALAPRSSNDDPPPPAPGGQGPKQNDPLRKGATGYGPLAKPGVERVHVRISNAAPRTIVVRPGDELILAVSGAFGDDIEIPGLGLVETMTVNAPAVFDILADETGAFPVRAADANRLVATIDVTTKPPKARPARNQAKRRQGSHAGPSKSASGGAHHFKRSLPAGPKPQ